MVIRKICIAILAHALLVKQGVVATGDSCTDSAGYRFALLSAEFAGDYYVYSYLVDAGTEKTGLSHWNVFMPDSCGATASGTCALGGIFQTQEATCANPTDTNPSQCNIRSWKVGTSTDIMKFKIHKSRVIHPTGGIAVMQSQSGNQSGSLCPTCQVNGPVCASAPEVKSVDKSQSTFYQWISSYIGATNVTNVDNKQKDINENDKTTNVKKLNEQDKVNRGDKTTRMSHSRASHSGSGDDQATSNAKEVGHQEKDSANDMKKTNKERSNGVRYIYMTLRCVELLLQIQKN